MAYQTDLLRLPDPTTTPAGPGFVSLSLQPIKTGLSHELNTGGMISVEYAGSYFTIDISYPELTVQEANSFFPTLSLLTGGFRNFYVQLPTHVNPSSGAWGTGSNTLIAKGAISLGLKDNEITVPAWDTRGGDLNPGDAIKFDNSNKIYLVAYTSTAANVKTIGLHCSILQKDLLPTAGFEPNDIKFRVRMPQIQLPRITARGVYEAFSISLRENIL